MKPSRATLLKQLFDLGIREGDVLFVSSDLMRVGYFNKTQTQTMQDWINIFSDLLGPSGTIFIPSYSEVYPRYKRNKFPVFTPKSPSQSGSLANAYIQLADNSVRSPHPAYSCIAVGPLASKLSTHNTDAGAYDPYGIIIENNGKNLMLGTIDEKNCPMSFHYAQQVLGHTKTHPLCRFFKTSYFDDAGKHRQYIMREIGGCTRGVHNLWGRHLAANAVKFGQVGRSKSGLVDTSRSYEIMLDALKHQPSVIKCNDRLCISCYGRFRYNGLGVIGFYPWKLFQLITNIVSVKT